MAKVLIVDDDELMAKALCRMVEMYARTVTRFGDVVTMMAESCEEAVALAAGMLKCGSPFDVVVTDVDMPGGDGFELIELLRKLPGPSPVSYLMSADVSLLRRERAKRLGCTVFDKAEWEKIVTQLKRDIDKKLGVSVEADKKA